MKTFNYFFNKYKVINSISFFVGELLLNFDEIKKFVEYLHENYREEEIPRMTISSNVTIMNEEIKSFLLLVSRNLASSLTKVLSKT